jgi:peptidoglycan/LPS O-acetylase OafA/YrhL
VLCFQVTVLLRERSKRLPAAQAIALAAAFLLYKLPSTAQLSGAVLSTVLLIATLQQIEVSRSVFSTLQVPPVRFIGKTSYSLYLWHWPVFVLARWTTGFETPLQLACALAIALVLSVGSYYLVETPFRQPQNRTDDEGL